MLSCVPKRSNSKRKRRDNCKRCIKILEMINNKATIVSGLLIHHENKYTIHRIIFTVWPKSSICLRPSTILTRGNASAHHGSNDLDLPHISNRGITTWIVVITEDLGPTVDPSPKVDHHRFERCLNVITTVSWTVHPGPPCPTHPFQVLIYDDYFHELESCLGHRTVKVISHGRNYENIQGCSHELSAVEIREDPL